MQVNQEIILQEKFLNDTKEYLEILENQSIGSIEKSY